MRLYPIHVGLSFSSTVVEILGVFLTQSHGIRAIKESAEVRASEEGLVSYEFVDLGVTESSYRALLSGLDSDDNRIEIRFLLEAHVMSCSPLEALADAAPD